MMLDPDNGGIFNTPIAALLIAACFIVIVVLLLIIFGKIGFGANKKDITAEGERIKTLQRMMYRHKILAEVLTYSFQSMQEELDYVLHQSLLLTESQYGYIYLYNEEKHEFTLNSWTNGVMQDCAVTDQQTKYQLEQTGIWGEVVRQRKPILVNNFNQADPLKKGFPQGHVQLENYMSIPVIVDEKIVAVVGLANNKSGYDENDVTEMTILMNGVWNAFQRKEMQHKLAFERNKYLQTLISIGDGVMIVDRNGNIEILNSVAEKLTGWKKEEAQGRQYTEVFVLSSELEDVIIKDPIAGVLETDMNQELGNHMILTSRDGEAYFIEDSAAPIKDNFGVTQGVVLVFRDVTDRKEQRNKIEFLSFHDSLTGLYNRRYFEEEIHRLDTERNLPMSIIMGDVNSLKLTNDVFGHALGDQLLKKVAEVLRNVCRADDIVARWGGDEFVILLPKTGTDETEKIVARIKETFAKERIKAIKGTVSVGFDAKQDLTEDIMHVLNRAEENMYLQKTLERDEIRRSAINDLMTSLHEAGTREKDHSIIVSELCQKLGRAHNLDEAEIQKLKRAGYLHDIGKIVLAPKLLKKHDDLTSNEQDEIKRHTTVGYRLLSSFDDTMDLADAVLSHHERWDGSGYPQGWKGEQIPLISRMISIVETYERVLNRSEMPLAERKRAAIEVIRKGAGSQFDPKISESFVQMLAEQS